MNENHKKAIDKIKANLKVIRDELDKKVSNEVIDDVVGKALNLTQLSGLASESKASARKFLELARLMHLTDIQEEKISPSIMSKKLDALCCDEIALYEYADRLNASISHTLDTLRSIISLYKEEINNSLK